MAIVDVSSRSMRELNFPFEDTANENRKRALHDNAAQTNTCLSAGLGWVDMAFRC